MNWMSDKIIQYSSRLPVNSMHKLTALINKEHLSGRSFIEADDDALAKLAGDDSELLRDVTLLSHRLKNRAKCTSPITPRSPAVWDIFSETGATGASPVSPTSSSSSPINARGSVDPNPATGRLPGEEGNVQSPAVEETPGGGSTGDNRHDDGLDTSAAPAHSAEESGASTEPVPTSSTVPGDENILVNDLTGHENSIPGAFADEDGDANA